ncbi:MAG: RecX family transcriptional regulator [Sneathiella sp.]
MNENEEPDKPKKPPKPPKVITPALLRGQALRYLDRFAATTTKMQRHLMNKSKKAIEYHELDPETVLEMIDVEIDKLEKAGILNDQEYASSKARSMARQGKSKIQIGVKLNTLGFDELVSDNAFTELRHAGHNDRLSAAKYIKKRRFGPFKPRETREDRLNKELSSLVRNGYEFALAETLLSLETTEEIEAIIYGE